MNFIAAAILLGLAGNLHCLGMCGPIALALPIGKLSSGFKRGMALLLYNLGRSLTYVLLGIVVGIFGQQIALFGYQQQLSIAIGIMMLIGVALPFIVKHKKFENKWLGRIYLKINSRFQHQLRQKGMTSLLAIGMLNGLLPCGLLYIAVATALATANPIDSALFMFVFSLGTYPVMFLVPMLFNRFRQRVNFNFKMVLSTLSVIVAIMLIVRGSNLGINNLSPEVKQNEVHCCSKPHE